jgi:phage shock protein A
VSDAAPPSTPFDDPPSISEAVDEHLRVIDGVKSLQRAVRKLESQHGHLADEMTVVRATAERVERKLDRLLLHFQVPLG